MILAILTAALALQSQTPQQATDAALAAERASNAATISSLQSQITALTAQLAAYTALQTACPTCISSDQAIVAAIPQSGQPVWKMCGSLELAVGVVYDCLIGSSPVPSFGVSPIVPPAAPTGGGTTLPGGTPPH